MRVPYSREHGGRSPAIGGHIIKWDPIPDASPAHLASHSNMFDSTTVCFGKDRKNHIVCAPRTGAEFVKLLADLHVHGEVMLPSSDPETARLREKIEERVNKARTRFDKLARNRTGLEEKQDEVVDLLLRWFVSGAKHKPNFTVKEPILIESDR